MKKREDFMVTVSEEAIDTKSQSLISCTNPSQPQEIEPLQQQQSPQTENHQRQVRFKNVPRKPPQPQQLTTDMTSAFQLILKTELTNTENGIKKDNKENFDRLQD